MNGWLKPSRRLRLVSGSISDASPKCSSCSKRQYCNSLHLSMGWKRTENQKQESKDHSLGCLSKQFVVLQNAALQQPATAPRC